VVFAPELHPIKTWLIEFDTYAAGNRTRRGEGKPERSGLLGFNGFIDR
jgi:RNA-directed DNA polymerase